MIIVGYVERSSFKELKKGREFNKLWLFYKWSQELFSWNNINVFSVCVL